MFQARRWLMAANSSSGQGLRRTAAGRGGIFVGCEESALLAPRGRARHCPT